MNRRYRALTEVVKEKLKSDTGYDTPEGDDQVIINPEQVPYQNNADDLKMRDLKSPKPAKMPEF